MQTAALIVLSLAFIGAAVAGPIVSDLKANTESRVLNMLAESTALSNSANPEIATECFSYYLTILNQTSVSFSVTYEQCITTANTATSNLNSNATSNLSGFTAQANAICDAFSKCNSVYDDYGDFFSCYASAASGDVSKIYSLSVNALNAALTLKSELQGIQTTQSFCTDNAQNNYVAQTTQVFSELNACFLNGLPKGITAPTTTTAAPDYYN